MDDLEILEDLPEIHAGFPSPSQDYMKGVIDLNKELVHHPAATFYGRVVGDSMVDAGVQEGDVLIIDKALEPVEGDLCVSYVDGEFALKRLSLKSPSDSDEKGVWLLPANPKYKPIRVEEGNDFLIWGVVTYIIKRMR